MSRLLGRLAAAIPVLLTVAVLVFVLLRSGLSDPAATAAGDGATTAQLAAARSEYGLDRPLLEQFATWFGKAVTGDLGRSFFFDRPVVELLGQRLEPTLSLTAATLLLSVAIAVPLGAAAAHWRGSWLDRGLMGFSVLGFSVPSFVIAYALVWVFALKLGVLPVQGYEPLARGILPWLRHIALPALSLAPVFVAVTARMTRASVIEALQEDYVRTARAKGLSAARVLTRHALRNAAAPILTVVAVGIALLLGGVVVTENVFNIPGLGRLMIDAVLAGDYPVVQGVILLSALTCIAVNLLTDLAYGLLDPRMRT